MSPLARVRDAGNLLTRAGLSIPSVDVDDITVRYPHAAALVEHLRRTAEGNAVRARKASLPRDVALATAAAYQGLFGSAAPPPHPASESGKPPSRGIPATFQVIFLTGWSPAGTQSKAKNRGSATVSFKDLASAAK